MSIKLAPPENETILMARCKAIEGLTLEQLAKIIAYPIPLRPLQRKGWAGAAIESVLGADAGNQSLPDFVQLGIELKTIPINLQGKPAESTFITSIPLLTIHQQTWEVSQCRQKLKRVLWVPVEGDQQIPYPQRRIGAAQLWSPNMQQETILRQDWEELTEFIVSGQLATINARYGQFLQIRPKSADSKSLCYSFDEEGNKCLTLPRGFYLRSSFTATLAML